MLFATKSVIDIGIGHGHLLVRALAIPMEISCILKCKPVCWLTKHLGYGIMLMLPQRPQTDINLPL